MVKVLRRQLRHSLSNTSSSSLEPDENVLSPQPRRRRALRRRRLLFHRESPPAEKLPLSMALPRLPHERRLDLPHYRRAHVASGVPRSSFRDQPFHPRTHRPCVGELVRGFNRQRGDGAERRSRRSAGGDFRLSCGAHFQYPHGLGIIAILLFMERVSGKHGHSQRPELVPDDRLSDERFAVGPSDFARERDEAR